jgi:hypothetical protein
VVGENVICPIPDCYLLACGDAVVALKWRPRNGDEEVVFFCWPMQLEVTETVVVLFCVRMVT